MKLFLSNYSVYVEIKRGTQDKREGEGVYTHNVGRQLVAGQVLYVLVGLVDDLGELPPVHNLLVDVHGDTLLEGLILSRIGADDLRDRRAPVNQ